MDTRVDTKRGMTSIGICSKPVIRTASSTLYPLATVVSIAKAKIENNKAASVTTGVTSRQRALQVTKLVKETRAFKLSSKLNWTSFDRACEWRRVCELGCEKDYHWTLASESARDKVGSHELTDLGAISQRVFGGGADHFCCPVVVTHKYRARDKNRKHQTDGL